MRGVFVLAAWVGLAAPASWAQDMAISERIGSFGFSRNGVTHTITRTPGNAQRAVDLSAALDPTCPPSCVQPMQVAPGVATIGELEVLDFMAGPLAQGTGLLVDARLEDWFAQGSLPGAISMPYPALAPDNSFLPDILQALGAVPQSGGWSFDGAFDLLVFGNGPSSDMATQAIAGLLAAGYPPAKLRWYRGGVIGWTTLGLSMTGDAE